MEKELYNELVNNRLITDVTMTLDSINENGARLEDILTQPVAYAEYSKDVEEGDSEDIVVDEETPEGPTLEGGSFTEEEEE